MNNINISDIIIELNEIQNHNFVYKKSLTSQQRDIMLYTFKQNNIFYILFCEDCKMYIEINEYKIYIHSPVYKYVSFNDFKSNEEYNCKNIMINNIL